MKPVYDQLGFEIQIGDIITYPVRQSSSLWMSFGVVREITTRVDWNDQELATIKLAVVSTKFLDDDTLFVRNTSMETPSRATVVHQFLENNLPETSYYGLNQRILCGLRTIRKAIMENKDVPKELQYIPSGPNNRSVV